MTETRRIVIAHGRTAEVLAWQEDQVLKLFYDWVSTDSIEQECRIAQLVSATNLPTPELIGEKTLDGRRGLIYERVTGKSLLTNLSTQPWSCIRFARQFAELQAAIHRQNGADLPSVKDELEQTIRGVAGLPDKLRLTALEKLARLPNGKTLCHFDFHPDQVMVTATGLVVLDWMTAHCGNPAADVARTTVLIRFGPVLDANWMMGRLVNLLRGIFYRTYIRRTLELTPAVTSAAINLWLPPVAMARLAEDIPGEKGRLLGLIQRAYG
jgi:aminoglycoside phosphotransferase (APT) family kinase protein